MRGVYGNVAKDPGGHRGFFFLQPQTPLAFQYVANHFSILVRDPLPIPPLARLEQHQPGLIVPKTQWSCRTDLIADGYQLLQ